MNERTRDGWPRSRRGRGAWLFIILVAVFLHLVFIVTFRPAWLEIFREDLPGPGDSGTISYLDRPFSLIPLPDDSPEPEITDNVIVTEDPAEEIFDISELGELDENLLPGESGSRGGSPAPGGGRSRSTVEPKPLYIPWPEYPDNAPPGIEGTVELLVFVNENGEVEAVHVARGLPHDLLNRAAVRAARRIRFSPGREKGVPTAMWMRLAIGFQPQ